MEQVVEPPDDAAQPRSDGPGEAPEAGPDRDLAALESLEQELASLEGELDRVERVSPPAEPEPEPSD